MTKPFSDARVAAVFQAWPAPMRRRLMALRETIFKVAANTPGVGALEETLKWGEPAYLTTQSGTGSTLRIAWKPKAPTQYAMYFICTTGLVDSFRSVFAHDFVFEGNRAIVFEQDDTVPMDALAVCIAAALTYRRRGPTRA